MDNRYTVINCSNQEEEEKDKISNNNNNNKNEENQMIDGVELKKKDYWIGKRVVFTVLSSIGLMIAYAFRVELSLAIIPMSEDHWSGDTEGIILSAFYAGYTLFMIPSGWLAKKYGGKIAMALAMASTSFFIAITPLFVQSVPLLFFVRFLTGVGEAVIYPALHEMIAQWIPASERSRVVPFIWSGAYVGTAIAFSVSPKLIVALGWPALFYTLAGIGFCWTIPWWFLVFKSPEDHPSITNSELRYIIESTKCSARSEEDTEKIPFNTILTSAPVWAIVIANFSHNWGFYVLLSFTPTYFEKHLAFDFQASGFLTVLPYLTMALIAPPAGFLADKLIQKGIASATVLRKVFVGVGFFGAAMMLIAINFVSRVPAVMIMVAISGFLGIDVAGWAVNHIDLSPKWSGVLLGLTNGIGNLPGFIGVWLSGWILDFHNRNNWAIIFCLSAGIYICGGILYIIFGTAKKIQALN